MQDAGYFKHHKKIKKERLLELPVECVAQISLGLGYKVRLPGGV